VQVPVPFYIFAAAVLSIKMPLLAQIQPDAVPVGGDAKASAALDEQYRKLDRLAAFLRTQNAKQFAITSVQGIDEASYVRIGGIEQWVTIRGQIVPTRCCSFCTEGLEM
jgi:hypothetical protein